MKKSKPTSRAAEKKNHQFAAASESAKLRGTGKDPEFAAVESSLQKRQ